MRSFFQCIFIVVLSYCISNCPKSYATSGFSLPDSLKEFSLRYKTIDNLIILPVIVNDSIELNLILDTGCRNVILFGKRFKKIFDQEPNKTIQFSGMGSGKPIQATLSLNNRIGIGSIYGKNIPIVLVGSKEILLSYDNVHGLIGYDIFTRFEIELNPVKQLITFRSPGINYIPEGYTKIPINVIDSKPMMRSQIGLFNSTSAWDLLIDTGSTLGLLLKSTDIDQFNGNYNTTLLGKGLNGHIKGIETTAKNISIEGYEIKNLPTGIVHSPWHNNASLGMGVLKDYSLILNYCQSYAAFKKVT